MNDDDFATLAVPFQALRRWQRRHGLLGKAKLVLADNATRSLFEHSLNVEGVDDASGFLNNFADIIEIAPSSPAPAE